VLTWEEYRAETVFEPWDKSWPLQAVSLRTRACPGRKVKAKRVARVGGGMCMRCIYWIYGQAGWMDGNVYFPHGIAPHIHNSGVHKGCRLPQKHSTRDISFLILQVFMAVTSQFTSSSRTECMILDSCLPTVCDILVLHCTLRQRHKVPVAGGYLVIEYLRIKSQKLMLSMTTVYKVHPMRNSHTWQMY
jgi:hypothetical protein